MMEDYQELIDSVTNEYNKDYTVAGLLDRLMKDDSWEPDPAKRLQAIIMLKIKFDNA